MEKGLVHIYTGDGKGKTTCATGLCARAAGQGLRAAFFQFMKSGHTGETVSLARLGVTVVSPRAGTKFIWDMDEAEKAACRELQTATFRRAVALAPELDLLALDEVVCAVQVGMLEEAELLAFLAAKPEGLELILTGRGAGEALCARAAYITEMRCVKHPFDEGQAARRGVEF